MIFNPRVGSIKLENFTPRYNQWPPLWAWSRKRWQSFNPVDERVIEFQPSKWKNIEIDQEKLGRRGFRREHEDFRLEEERASIFLHIQTPSKEPNL